jgi:hypothetical protein
MAPGLGPDDRIGDRSLREAERLPNFGHFLGIDAPEESLAAVRGFLDCGGR